MWEALSFVLIFSLSSTAFAADINSTQQNDFLPTVSYESLPEAYPSNLISIESYPRTDGTGIDVFVGNLGIDGLDSVTISVTATDHSTAQTQTGYVPILFGKTFSFDIPMTKCKMTYNIKVKVVDGTQTQNFNRTAKLEYSEDQLASISWDAGTFNSRQDSANYHFGVHHDDVGVDAENMVQYMNLALDTYNDTISNPNNYKIVAQAERPNYKPAHKYTNKTNYRFIIYSDDSSKSIYTFGGK